MYDFSCAILEVVYRKDFCDEQPQCQWLFRISKLDKFNFFLRHKFPSVFLSWGTVFIISAVSGGPRCTSHAGDLFPSECYEVEEWGGSPVDLNTSDTLGLGLCLLSGYLINGVGDLTTRMTLLADAISLPIRTQINFYGERKVSRPHESCNAALLTWFVL